MQRARSLCLVFLGLASSGFLLRFSTEVLVDVDNHRVFTHFPTYLESGPPSIELLVGGFRVSFLGGLKSTGSASSIALKKL